MKSLIKDLRGLWIIFFGIGRGQFQEGQRVAMRERVCVEPFLPGRFVKVNSNNGWTMPSFLGWNTEVPQAFSHWTWVQSGETCLVCDLQGVQNDEEWMFTDPAIHSLSGERFGLTDLGKRGINAFFASHQCNSLCKHLPRPPVVVDPGFEKVRRTSFRFECPRASSMVHHQIGGTCYAHASATIVRSAEKRIVGRRLVSHEDLVGKIVQKYGCNGGHVKRVLQDECPSRCLRFKESSKAEAQVALQLGRPVLAAFYLTESQWTAFSTFFDSEPRAVLEQLPTREQSDTTSGHAVVIVGQEGGNWKFKNSWGDTFADDGYFRVSKICFDRMQSIYFDVFFYESELSEEDRLAYSSHLKANERLFTIAE
mmetsp:Transcript_103400/g.183264  ORF Transcript_103400/g.183264 Transcript_103400/m.183264 type:complete len:367 (+) Transcript_103400:485-1585(+)